MKRRSAALLLGALAVLLGGCRPAPKPKPEPPKQVEAPKAVVASVYFPNMELTWLEAEARDTLSGDPAEQAAAAVKALLAGPEEDGHARVIPRDVKLNGLTVKEKTATVDLSSAFVDKFKGGSNVASLAVYSLVNTVTSISGIEQVVILVEGQPQTDFAGALSLAEPLRADPKLNGGEKLGK